MASTDLSTWANSGRPARGWSIFGNVERIRVPLPAARTTVAYVFIVECIYPLQNSFNIVLSISSSAQWIQLQKRSICLFSLDTEDTWIGCQDSNLGIADPKSAALP